LPAGWGLIEVGGRVARLARKSDNFIERNHFGELQLLIAYVRRVEGASKPLRKIGPRPGLSATKGPLLDLIA